MSTDPEPAPAGAAIGPRLRADELLPDQRLDADQEDRFRYEAIAARLTELVAAVKPPVNIALYGSWGTGKSSVGWLFEQAIAQRNARADDDDEEQLGFVRYDAWRFGGHALKRNFISHTASELGIPARHRDFRRGLYEDRRTVELSPKRLFKGVFRGVPAVAALFVFFNIAAALVLGLASLRHGAPDWWGQIKQSQGTLLQASGLIAFVAAALRGLLESGRVEISEGKPSEDEEFTERFDELINVACADKPGLIGRAVLRFTGKPAGLGYDRLVVLVDELDRCTEDDVVETLVALRTFLDRERCVFLVAADRRVLDQALQNKLKQASPRDEIAPSDTAASGFLDKIFAHQLELPPLRGRRLSRYARDVLTDRRGVWDILRQSKTDPLNDVLGVLVPPHVRNPRRVKVLLNRFATNYRIAEGRGIDLTGRAQELAKLTVLQTEFPKLAADLHVEPRLVRFLLDEDPPQSPRARELWNKHQCIGPDAYLHPDAETQIAGPETGGPQKAVSDGHREQLRRYLQITQDVDGPDRSLLFLEAAGEAFDLDDIELGDEIEDKAPDFPDLVIAKLDDQRPIKDRNAAVRLLADIAHDVLGAGKVNTVHAMLAVAAGLGRDITTRALNDAITALTDLASDLDGYGALPADDIVPAFAICTRAGRENIADALVADDRLWNSEDLVIDLIGLFADPSITVAGDDLGSHLGYAAKAFPSLTSRAISELPDRAVVTLLSYPPVRTSLAEATIAGDPEEVQDAGLATMLQAASEQHHAEFADAAVQILEEVATSDPVRAAGILAAQPATALTAAADRSRAWDVVLRAIAASPIENRARLVEASDALAVAGERRPSAGEAVLAIVGETGAASQTDREACRDHLDHLVAHAELPDEEQVRDAVTAALPNTISGGWAVSEEDRGARREIYSTLDRLRDAGHDVAVVVDNLIAEDLARAVQAVRDPEVVIARPGGTRQRQLPHLSDVLALTRERGAELSPADRETLLGELPELDADEFAGQAIAVLDTRIALIAAAPEAQRRKLVPSLTAVAMSPVFSQPATRTGHIAARWLDLGPALNEVQAAVDAYGQRSPDVVTRALTDWAARLDRRGRTRWLRKLLADERNVTGWIASLAASGEAEHPKLVRRARELISDTGQAERRRHVASNLAAIKPQGPTATTLLAELVADMARTRHLADLDVAIAALGGWTRGSAGQRTVEQAMTKALRDRKPRLTEEQGRILVAAGVEPPADSFGERVWNRLTKTVGGVADAVRDP